MASLTDKAALLIVANGLKYAVGFILPMVLVRLLSQDEYGTYQQLSLVASFGTGIMVLGLPMSIYYFYHHRADEAGGRPTLIAQTQAILLLSGAITALAIALTAPEVAARMSNPQLAQLLPLYSLYVGLYIAGEHFLHVMISQNRYVMAVGLETAETAFRVCVLVCLLALGFRLHALVIALAVYAGLRLAVRSYWLWQGTDSVRNASWPASFPLQQLAYSLPLAASSGIGMLGGLLDRAIVAVSFTPTDYAIYSVGALEIPLDVIFQASVSNVLRASLPPLVRAGRTDEIIRIWRESVRKLAIIFIPSFVFLSFFASTFITTLFTSHYDGSVAVFRIYLWLTPLGMVVLSTIPQVYGKTRLNLYVVSVAVSSNALLSVVLLRVLGILGPALAMVISSYVASSLYFIVTMRLLRASAVQLLPLGAFARTTLAAGIATLPALGVAYLIDIGLLALACGGLTFAVAYGLAGYFLKVFSGSDIDSARSWIRRVLPAAS